MKVNFMPSENLIENIQVEDNQSKNVQKSLSDQVSNLLKKVYKSGATSKLGNPSEPESNPKEGINQQFLKPPIQPSVNKSIDNQSLNKND